jgi:pimeloyl-ACP methyl ester carboxylesterase
MLERNMLQKKNIIVQNLSIQYYQSESIDKNNALVFLHGWGSRALHFQKTLDKCENAIAIDLPGFGNSQAPYASWSLSDYSIFIHEFLEKIDIKKPILAGHSFGGSIGIKYSAQYKDIKKLILIGSAGVRERTMKKYFYLVVAKIFGIIFSLLGVKAYKEKIRKRFYKAIDSEDYANAGALSDTYKKIIDEDLKKDMKKIDVPVVIIWGESDKETPLADGKLMEALIRGSELRIIPGAGHYAFLDNEKAFEEIFLPSLK